MRTCVHFRGAVTTCAAGQDVETYRDGELRLACMEIRGAAGQIACPHRGWPAGAPPGEPGRMTRRLERIFANRCPTCDQPIADTRDVGGRIYANPCRHLLSEVS